MAKGNDGKAARQRTMKKLLIAVICAFSLVLGVVYFGENGGNNVNSSSGSFATKTFEKTLPKHKTKKDGIMYDDDKVEKGSRHKHHNLNDRMKKHNHGNDDGSPGRKVNPRHHVDGGRGGRAGRGHGRGDRLHNNRGGRPKVDDEEEGESLQHRKFHDGNREGGPAAHNKHHNQKDHRRVHERGGGGGGGGGGDHKMHNRHVSPGDDEEESDTDDKSNKNDGDDDDGEEEENEEDADDQEKVMQQQQKKNIDNDIVDDELADTYFNELAGPSVKSKHKRFIEMVLNGKLNLVKIEGTPTLSQDGSYDGVVGSFCQVNFALHKEDPSSYPMFRFLEAASPGCQNPTKVDLKKVALLARQRDKKIKAGEVFVGEGKEAKLLNLTAVAFHESRCGSTLVANSMIAMDPIKHRTYSESPPPVNAYTICGDDFDRCTQEQAASVLRDVIYLMSRTDDQREERVFFKFQSITSKKISTFQMAFPHVPWMYVYRDPVQVMMSHVKDDPTIKKAICTRSRNNPPKEVHAIAKRHGRSDATKLKPAEYCAAHLAMLTESAVHSLNDMAIPVAYDQLPSMMWEKIMPKIFGRPLTQTEIENLENISKSYSKGGKRNDGRKGEFKSDSEQKEKNAPQAVKDAAEVFLKESFDQLTAFGPKLFK
ncbi:hypothetical protein FRACYDRAFT_235907 [Fragilariopsis cylindrus CCMP1102]|uniref:Sulfotransferase domain-containing protein n=1 Tax=Fragilariopsis cylindrus CCMP1102 TaxID=635003 RepID=A0A1E7FNX9_9STRA|nr:hypothetical protein FRACYDRAFT_235907 [Fragilariopsis cylindrus CCMP1102]|eukprot:OEU19846.1 hypothetical protein FRACYDRAFT_235907 [Fragilariopsis cylindrus CCMP1102]